MTMGKTNMLEYLEFLGISGAIKSAVALNKSLGISLPTVTDLQVEDFDKQTCAKA
jgi:hypothetical protein